MPAWQEKLSSPHPETDTKRETPTTEERWARRICELGNYHEIVTLLRSNHHIFESQRMRVSETYADPLEKVPFLSPADWEMTTILELYDRETFEHSLRVFESIQEKITSRREIGLFLRGRLRQEDVRTEDLLRAALHHDIGKVAIPKEVLRDSTSDEEWQIFAKTSLDPETYASILERFERNPKLRAKDVVPFSCTTSPHITEILRDRGIDPEFPLGVIIGKHADISGDILRSYGFSIAAEIAESHHNRPLREENHPVSISSFRASWILRAADIFDAIRSSRAYKKERSLDSALGVLEEEVSAGFIDSKLANLWIADEFKREAT